ncbi:hypothetical protein EXIGLDRAFT_318639 [Exidia glandulosa HHB12029]|uniref:Uncharacterized protein n=1 Tax=Exidia glandulosa HHB12029 TaxID=1314781 RepID=A0A165Q2Y9_EXIGL|nr:hypothetical protein EXIGLDRAFT_318639 [Exidia glandulosa HHB12029]
MHVIICKISTFYVDVAEVRRQEIAAAARPSLAAGPFTRRPVLRGNAVSRTASGANAPDSLPTVNVVFHFKMAMRPASLAPCTRRSQRRKDQEDSTIDSSGARMGAGRARRGWNRGEWPVVREPASTTPGTRCITIVSRGRILSVSQTYVVPTIWEAV